MTDGDRPIGGNIRCILEGVSMANNHYELDRAHMESIRNEFEDAYFKARPQIDTMDRRRVFQASFERAWQAACKYKDKQTNLS